MQQAKISIIMATYNRANYIKEAIESILRQSFRDWELVVIDDNSVDNTEEIIMSYMEKDSRFIYIKNLERQGVGRARNIGIAKSQGKYIAILDSDDVWHDREKLEEQYNYLETHPDYVIVGGDAIIIDENGKVTGKITCFHGDKEIRRKILAQNRLVHSGVLYRRDIYEKCGKYDEKLAVGEDYDLWLKMGLYGKIECLNKSMVLYRKHSGNESMLKIGRSLKHNIEVIDKHKEHYPNYLWASIRRRARFLAAKLIFWRK
ncbi:MAG TPA: glycosyltransferase [Candidatus Pacearchaeota archaeon]|nr:glycosyltransferase [Candidatus Pacearchaeota archaeon]